MDVSGRFDYAIDKREGPVYVKGTYVTVAIPFDGDGQLFQFTLPAAVIDHKGDHFICI